MTPTSSQGSQMDVEARFAHLLNPIRDLAKNWNIDLSSNLEDYLAELGNVKLVFDNGKTTMNFAQAALLIQGSACVYSKKVEYLYNLAFEILKVFSNKKNNDKQQKQADDNSFTDDHVDEFLSLDDIEIDKNLEKKEDDGKNKGLSFKYLSKTPTVLMPSENCIKGDVMLYNRSGDLIGNKNDFQVNGAKIHSSGLLVIDSSLASQTIDMKVSGFQVPLQAPLPLDNSASDDDLGTCASPLPADDFDMEDENMNNIPPSPPPMEAPEVEHKVVVDECVEKPNEDDKSVRRSLRVKEAKHNQLIQQQKQEDKLKLVDPYEPTNKLLKPIRKLRRCVLPESLASQDKPSSKKSKIQHNVESVSDFCCKQFEKKKKNKFNFQEFEDEYWQEMNRRKQMAAKRLARVVAREEKAKLLAEQQSDNEDDDDDGDNGCCSTPDMPFDDEEDFAVNNDLGDILSQHNDMFSRSQINIAKTEIVQSYEDLVREQVDKYMSSAVNYAQLSDLGKRVKEWEERIRPRLDEEDKHESFDIHVYGSRVLQSFQNSSKEETKSFQEICKQKPKFEVCRLFLASLQLANNYNVEIGTCGAFDDAVDTMSLKMLSSNRHHEQLEEYRAPSVN